MELEIQEVVTKKYKVDGIVFDTHEQAQKWKEYIESLKKETTIRMFMNNGEETEDVSDADIIYLKGERAATEFIKRCKEGYGLYEGIEEEDEGFFYWGAWSRYEPLEEDMVETWYNVIQKIKNGN